MHPASIVVLVVLSLVVLSFVTVLLVGMGKGSFSTRKVRPGSVYSCGGHVRQVPRGLVFHFTPYFVKEEHRNKLLGLFREMTTLFEKHGITYWITAGTLLGALRHGGFVPWDDDVDLAVLQDQRKDLEALPWHEHGMNLVVRHGDTSVHFHRAKHAYPYIDLVYATEHADRKMHFSADYDAKYPGEVWPKEWIFPVRKLPFETLRVCAPNQARRCVLHNYGETALHEVKARNRWERFLPWIFNRRMAMISGIHD